MLKMNKVISYMVLGMLAWLIAEYVTVWREKGIEKWVSHMPAIFIFYIGWVSFFAFLIFVKKWNNKKLFLTTIILGFILELTFFHNSMLYTFPRCLYAVPALVLIYSFLTFLPKWIVNR